MNSVKLIIIIAAFSVFVTSCGQSPPAANTTNIGASRVVSNVASNANSSSSGPDKSLRSNRSAQVAEVADIEEKVVDLYSEKCMICHKDTGKGGKITLEGKTITPADLTSAKIKAKSDEKLLSEIKEGVPDEGMPSFKAKLSDEEIKSIIQKIRKF